MLGESLDDDDVGDVGIENDEQVGRVGSEAFSPDEHVRGGLDIGQVDLDHPTEADGAVLERRLDDVEVGDDLRNRVHLRADEGVEVVRDPLRAADGELDLNLSGKRWVDFGPSEDFDFAGEVTYGLRWGGMRHRAWSLHFQCLPCYWSGLIWCLKCAYAAFTAVLIVPHLRLNVKYYGPKFKQF